MEPSPVFIMGVKLTYDAGLSYDCYCHDDLRGGRVFDLDAADPANVKTPIWCGRETTLMKNEKLDHNSIWAGGKRGFTIR